MDPAVQWILRVAFAGLFGVAALHKLRDRQRFAATLRDYRVLPTGGVPAAALAIPAFEAIVAAGLLVDASAPRAAAGGTALLGVYSLAIGVNLARGRRHIDCGCLGPRGREQISPALLVRNAVLLLGCVAIAVLPAAPRALGWIDGVSIGGGVIVVTLLAHAAGLLVRSADLGGAR